MLRLLAGEWRLVAPGRRLRRRRANAGQARRRVIVVTFAEACATRNPRSEGWIIFPTRSSSSRRAGLSNARYEWGAGALQIDRRARPGSRQKVDAYGREAPVTPDDLQMFRRTGTAPRGDWSWRPIELRDDGRQQSGRTALRFGQRHPDETAPDRPSSRRLPRVRTSVDVGSAGRAYDAGPGRGLRGVRLGSFGPAARSGRPQGDAGQVAADYFNDPAADHGDADPLTRKS